MNTDTLNDKFQVVDIDRNVVYSTLFAALALLYVMEHQGQGLVLVWPL